MEVRKGLQGLILQLRGSHWRALIKEHLVDSVFQDYCVAIWKIAW